MLRLYCELVGNRIPYRSAIFHRQQRIREPNKSGDCFGHSDGPGRRDFALDNRYGDNAVVSIENDDD